MMTPAPSLSPSLHVLGLQRSGTNYLVELVRQNMDLPVIGTGDRSVCWKHALLDEIGANASATGLSAGEAVLARPDVAIVLVAKHPGLWVSSIVCGNPQDIFLKRPALQSEGHALVERLIDFYNSYYLGWRRLLQDKPNAIAAQYEDCLCDPEGFLARVERVTGAARRGELTIPKKVPYTAKFTDDDRQRYLDFRHGLDETSVDIILSRCNSELLHVFGRRGSG